MQPGMVSEQNVKGTPKNMNSIAQVITMNCNVICNGKEFNGFISLLCNKSLLPPITLYGDTHIHRPCLRAYLTKTKTKERLCSKGHDVVTYQLLAFEFIIFPIVAYNNKWLH